ncbi:MAG TPA: hypothetical protein GX528_05020 [Firmicutes bacterium]|nr:hypothetical protein [Bacillota bacterium]
MARKAKDLVLAQLKYDRFWAYLELKNDPAFPYMSREEIAGYIDGALKFSRDRVQPYLGKEISRLAADLGVTIRCEELGQKVRAYYSRRVIFINSRALEEMAAKLSYLPFSLYQFKKATIAHELFHHLEEVKWGYVDQCFPPVIKLGRLFSRRFRVRALREIAAHRFAKELSQLPCLPNAFDWLIFCAENPKSHRQLYNNLSDVWKTFRKK